MSNIHFYLTFMWLAVGIAPLVHALTSDELLQCHDRAVGGERLREIDAIEFDLTIEEGDTVLDARYRAERTGQMRIDIYVGQTRVFSEWLEDGVAWQLRGGAEEPERSSPEGAAALWRGLQAPGRFWTLADMDEIGHSIEILDDEVIDGQTYHVFELTLSDASKTWYWVDPDSCRIVRSRNFRSFHPDIDPERVWTETVSDQFETTEGVTRPMRSRTINLETGEVMATTTVEAVRYETGAE